MQRTFTSLLVIGLLAAIPAGASAHPPRITFGAQTVFQPAAGYPAMPNYPITVRRTKFDRHTWCWSARLYDASTGIYGPYDASLTPPIFPTDPGLEGGDNCDDPTISTYAIMASVARGPNLYGTFGPATIISGIKVNPAVRRLRLTLPDGSIVRLRFLRGTFVYTTNSMLGPLSLTYRVGSVDTTISPL